MEDNAQTARRRQREKKTISQMIAIYCSAHHDPVKQRETAYCGDPLCTECAAIDAYAILRTERCRSMEVKTSCEECGNHCYKPEMREQIRAIMRYSGPRMLTKHPIAAVRHLTGK